MSSEETKTVVPETKYAILMETNGEECESWYYFIKYTGNENELEHLKKQIDQIEMYVLDDLSAFDIETENLVSEQTAAEMVRIEVNSVTFHRKFDGKMKFIDLKLKKKDSNERRIEKINDVIGMGDIENFVEGEDIPPEHLEESGEEDGDESDSELVPLPLNIGSDQNILSPNSTSSSNSLEKSKPAFMNKTQSLSEVPPIPPGAKKKKKKKH
jgi:predicted DNA-binding protein YlxM (UPF0122 family)